MLEGASLMFLSCPLLESWPFKLKKRARSILTKALNGNCTFIMALYIVFIMLSACIYGGGNRNTQIEAIRKGVEIIIGMSYCAI